MIEYRKATLNDIEQLLKIRIDFLKDAGNIRNEEDEKVMLSANEQFLYSSLSDGSFIQLLAFDGEKIAASSSVSFYTLPPNTMRPTGKTAYIGNMFTYPEYRNQGIATKLFSMIVDEAKQNGCSLVTLNATDMGKPIYEKYGFKKDDDAMNYYIII